MSLLSDGLDSPVAVYLMIQKGFNPICLSFLTSNDQQYSMRKKIIKIVKNLSKFLNQEIKIYFIDHNSNLETIKLNCERKLTCIICKRLMLRIAVEILKIEGTNLIVTGDILGEQASQTLDNLYAYNDVIEDKILLRPLIGLNKEEVIELNKKIGLYDIVSQKSAGCQYFPQYPETHAKLNEVLKEESRLNIEIMVRNSVKEAEILNI